MKSGARTAAALLTGASLIVLASAPAAFAATAAATAPATRTYDLPPQDLAEALRQIALISGRRFVAASRMLDGKRSGPVGGQLTAEQAYAQALAGSGLQLTTAGDMFVVVAPPAELPPTASKPAAPPATMSEITVTGTRIRGQAPIGANLIVLDRNDIDQSGYATTQQLLAALPQNFNGGPSETTAGFSARNNANLNMAFGSSVNLRGLGSDSTLVLLNGQRPAMGGVGGAFADISMVPANIVKRVEVLADGASALYGSDAVAGVVNFIFRDDFEGAETSVHYGSADGYDETQVSQLFGANWGSGHAVFAYEYYDHSALRGADRPFATENLVPFGGQDYRSAYAAPGNVVAANGLSFAIPAGSTGVGLLPSQLLAGQTNLTDEVRASDLLPDQQRHSFYASVHQDLGADTTLFAQGLFAERSFTDRIIPGDIPYTVPPTNPFYVDPIGTGQPVTVEYNLNADLGPQLLRGMVQAYDGEIGLDHRFGAWTAELLGSYGFEREYNGEYNLPNQAAIPAALADANPSTALNLFGSGASNNPATLNAIRGYSDGLSHSGVWSVSGKVDGPLFELPGGTVRVALGGEYRVESYKYTSVDDVDVLTPMTVPLAGIPGHREIGALFGELAIPLVAPDMNWPGVRKLQLSVAGRFEHYSDVGSTTNPKVGLDWSVVSGLDLRMSYGTSFRAPSFDDLRYAPDDIVGELVPFMLEAFLKSDRTFVKASRATAAGLPGEHALSRES